MSNTKAALVIVMLCGTLAACGPKPEAAAPEAAVQAEAPVAAPAPAPMAEQAMDADAPDGAATEGDGDSPHSGGDKVKPATN